MTDYSFRSSRFAKPERSRDDVFTRKFRKKVAQRKAERKALLERIWQQGIPKSLSARRRGCGS